MAVPGGTAAPEQPPFIGRYRVLDRIGKGAMGIVYSAEDESLGRRVAIKVMAGDLEEEPETRERFYREARVTGQLAHPNIVTVFDFGEDAGHLYLVMELLEGLPLLEHLGTPAAAGIDPRIALMVQTLEGLQIAHSRGVIHRDIKPSNLFVNREGTLKILDFGVARLAASSLTLNGFLLGTPEFMSPEQAQGRPVDARSDLFSAAAVFYAMLAGQGPFASPELPKILRAVVYEEPPPLTESQAPEPLRRVLMKALAKSPADRYQQCAEMLADLERIRRLYDATTRRIEQAALERYRQIVAVIEERRALGRSLGVADIGPSCDEAVRKLEARFPLLARHAQPDAFIEPMDRTAASAALESLQRRHNAALAALEALRIEAADRLRPDQTAPAAPGEDVSLRDRASALWRRAKTGDQS